MHGPSLPLCCLQELMRRCDTLIRLVEKENEDFDAAEREERKKGGGKKAGAASRATDSSGAAGASKVGLVVVWFVQSLPALMLVASLVGWGHLSVLPQNRLSCQGPWLTRRVLPCCLL